MTKRVDLARECQPLGPRRIKQRLYPKAVSSQNQTLFFQIIDRNGKHATQLAYEVCTILFIKMRQHLRICVSFKDMPPSFQFAPDLSMIINLAVKYSPNCTVFVCQRLRASLSQIDNTETRMHERSLWE